MVFGESPLKDVYRRVVWGPWRQALEAAPLGAEVRASAGLGRIAWRLARDRRDRLGGNVASALGRGIDVDRVVRAAFETHFANQYVGFLFHKVRQDSWPRALRLLGREHLDAALAEGRGVVVAHPHMGLPQLPLHVLGLLGHDVHQVGGGRTAVALSAEGERVAQLRADLESRIAATLHDGTSYLRPLLRVLGRNGIVFTAVDGTGGGDEIGRRVVREVLGRPMRLPVFPVWLARRTGATLLTLSTWRNDAPGALYLAEIEPPIPLTEEEAALDALADRLAVAIERHPGDWHFWDAWHPGEGGLLHEAPADG